MDAQANSSRQDDLLTIKDMAARLGKSVSYVHSWIRSFEIQPKGKAAPSPGGTRWVRLFSLADLTAARPAYQTAKSMAACPAADPDWRPQPDRTTLAISVKSSPRNLCPITKYPCSLSVSCAAGENDEGGRKCGRKSGAAQAAAEFCENYVKRFPQSQLRCRACAKFKTAACAFGCFRVVHEKFILSAFADSNRRVSDKKEVYTCTT